MKHIISFLGVLFCIELSLCWGLEGCDRRRVRIVSYNVENLFDTVDDPLRHDDEFLPHGSKHWGSYRYYTKLRHISEVLCRIGGVEWPALVGLVEVENSSVLDDLLRQQLLRRANYRYYITNGSDRRGINVALLYRPDLFEPMGVERHRVVAEQYPELKTRDVLEIWGRLRGSMVHIFVCHLPSRRGGARASEPYRCAVAKRIAQLSDSIQMREQGQASIVVMGDFNEDPRERAVHKVLGARRWDADGHLVEQELLPRFFNLFGAVSKFGPPGSYLYQGVWSQLDQILLSPRFLFSDSPLGYLEGSAQIYAPEWLLSRPRELHFSRPLSTYLGPQYIGGYSDHYPIYIDLELR